MRFRKTVDENLEPRGQSTKHGPHGLILRVEQIGRDGNICAQTEMETRGEALLNSLSLNTKNAEVSILLLILSQYFRLYY